MRTINKEMQSQLTPAHALEILKAGNNRFVNNLKVNRNLLQQVNETKGGQYPIAAILSCIDSRTSAELIFDQGLGDIFSIRIAGNVLNEDILGSMEFAAYYAGVKMIVVLGHTSCGAVAGACKGLKLGYLTQLLNKLEPAISLTLSNKGAKTTDMVNEVAKNNVHLTIADILEKSELLAKMVAENKLGIAGAMYDIESGHVNFFEQNKRVRQNMAIVGNEV